MGAIIFWSVFVLLVVALTIGIRVRRNRMRTLAFDVRETTNNPNVGRPPSIAALKDQGVRDIPWSE